VPKIPGVPHLHAVRALEKTGFTVVREGKHIVNHSVGRPNNELKRAKRRLGGASPLNSVLGRQGRSGETGGWAERRIAGLVCRVPRKSMNTSSQRRPDWATRRIECHPSGEISAPVWVVLPFECLFGLVLAAIPLLALVQLHPKQRSFLEYAGLLPFLVLLSGGGYWMLRGALRTTRQWRYAWGATFEMSAFPAVRGGQLEGVIHHPRLGTFGEFEVVLACMREYDGDRGAPADRFVPGSAVWSERQRVAAVYDEVGAAVPVSFQIPAHLPESDAFVYWRLEARPPLFGVVLFFDIPVLNGPATAAATGAATG
jgi:hypothetical protein